MNLAKVLATGFRHGINNTSVHYLYRGKERIAYNKGQKHANRLKQQ